MSPRAGHGGRGRARGRDRALCGRRRRRRLWRGKHGKLLLSSANDHHPNGLANGSDQVGRNYMFHDSIAVLALSREENPTVFQKTLGLNDFYFGSDDFEFPLGNIQMVKSSAEMFRGEKPGETRLAPEWTLDRVARHAIDFWLSTEDLPRPDNRVTLEPDGNIKLSYSETNAEAKKRLYGKLKSLLPKLNMNEGHLIHRFAYMKNDIPVAGVAHQAGTCRFGTDADESVLDRDCKAHELDNLYVVDTSIFPSIGAVNPALTAMANSLRVGDHLLERMGADSRSRRRLTREQRCEYRLAALLRRHGARPHGDGGDRSGGAAAGRRLIVLVLAAASGRDPVQAPRSPRPSHCRARDRAGDPHRAGSARYRGSRQPYPPSVEPRPGLLFFFAGLEVVEHHVPRRSLVRGMIAWGVSLSLGIAACCLVGGLDAEGGAAGIALSTTAVGTLVPILADAGLLRTPLGSAFLGMGVAGEFGPIVVISIFLTGVYGALTETLLLIGFGGVVLLAAAAALRARPPRVVRVLQQTVHTTGQAAVRLSIFILLALVFLAIEVGFDFVLGAFAGGLVVGLALSSPEAHPVRLRLEEWGSALRSRSISSSQG